MERGEVEVHYLEYDDSKKCVTCTVDPHISGPQLSGILGYLSAHSIQRPCCVWSQVAVLDRWNTRRCRNFNRPKPEEAKIRRLFASMMDNMTGKETAVLIMIHYRPYLHDDSLIRPWSGPFVAG